MVRRLSGMIAGSVLVSALCSGAGFQLYTEGSAEALGVCGAQSARRDAISNAWYNPASVAGWDTVSIMGGATWALLSSTYDTGLGFDNDLDYCIHTIPHLQAITPLTERLTLALTANAPYGLGTKWDGAFVDRLHGVQLAAFPGPPVYGDGTLWDMSSGTPLAFPQETLIACYYVTPALALQLNERMSVAFGVSVVKSNFEMTASTLDNTLAIQRIEFDGDGWGVGAVAAFNFEMHEHLRLGMVYRSPITIDYEGDAKNHPMVPGGRADVEGSVTLPPTVTLGLSTTCIDRLTLGFDVVWTGWSTFDSLVIEHENGTTLLDSPKDYDDVLSYRVGAEYEILSWLVGRLGYGYDESPTSDQYRGLELPGNNRHMFTVGVGVRGERWAADLAYCHILVEPAAAGSEALGDVGEFEDSYTQLLSFSVSCSF